MSTMGERLARALKERGETAADLVRATGFSKGTVYNIINGDTRPSKIRQSTVATICRALDISDTWLLNGTGQMRPEASVRRDLLFSQAAALGRGATSSVGKKAGHPLVSAHETPPGYIRFHVMGEAGAGPGMVNPEYPEVLREVELAEWQVRDQLGSLVSPQRVKLLTVRGDSMAPRIRSGDVVFVDIEDRAYDGDGNYVVILHGHALVKRLELRTDGLHIVSLADATRPDVVPPDDMLSLRIAGRVLGAIQIRRAEDL